MLEPKPPEGTIAALADADRRDKRLAATIPVAALLAVTPLMAVAMAYTPPSGLDVDWCQTDASHVAVIFNGEKCTKELAFAFVERATGRPVIDAQAVTE